MKAGDEVTDDGEFLGAVPGAQVGQRPRDRLEQRPDFPFNPLGNRHDDDAHNTIIAGNAANPNKGPDVNGTFTTQGFNLIGVQDTATSSFANGVNHNAQILGSGEAFSKRA